MEVDSHFLLWQSEKDGDVESDRITYEVDLVEISSYDSKLKFEAKKEDQLKLNQEKAVYFISRDKTIAFKGKCVSVGWSQIVIDFPESISVIEFRRFPRKEYPLEDRIEINFTYIDEQGNEKEAQAPMLNSSAGGVCLYLSKDTHKALSKAQRITFKDLERYIPEMPEATAQMRHYRVIQAAKLNLEEHLAVGFQFDEEED